MPPPAPLCLPAEGGHHFDSLIAGTRCDCADLVLKHVPGGFLKAVRDETPDEREEAVRVLRDCHDPHLGPVSARAEALAMKRRGRDSGRGGAGDVFSAFHLAIRDSALAQHAWAYVVSGHKTSLAPERVADARGNTVSPETVKRARKRFPPDTM